LKTAAVKETGSFLDEIALGRYVEGTSSLHLASTGWKATLFALVGGLAFLYQSASAFALVGLVVGILAWRAGLPQLLFWRSLRPVNLLVVFTLLAAAFWTAPDSSALHPVFSWPGLHKGGLYAARLVLITLLTTLFFLTTRPQQAIRFGIALLSPLRWVGISRQELSLLVHLAYRFVPLLRREIKEMTAGRMARNLPLPRSPLSRARLYLDAIVFIFVGALHRAEIMGLALEQRRVVEQWESNSAEGENGRGPGVWSVFLFLVSALTLWKDPLLL